MALRISAWICRLALGGLFAYAGYFKIRNPFLFEMAVDAYHLLPAGGVIVVARTLPWLEIALGLLLIAGWRLTYVAGFTALLLGTFVGAMSITYARGIEATCGCFGFGERISPLTLARDTAMVGLAVFLTVWSWKRNARARNQASIESEGAAPVSTET